MTAFLTSLASGAYLTPARIRIYCLMLVLGYAAALIVLGAGAEGLVDSLGRPLGTDFANVWSAGRITLRGEAAAAFDPAMHYREQQAIFGNSDRAFYGWHYPPFFLLLAALLAQMPYLTALFVWQAAGLTAYLATMRLILPGSLALLAALAYPAVFINLTHGQNGFLTASLIAAGLFLLDRRPWLTGLFIGLLAYKPHFGLLIPLVLVMTGRWRTIASASATVLTMIAAATLIFGTEVWRAFLANADFTSTIVLEAGSTGWEKIHSVFSVARALGVPVNAAYALHGAFVLALIAATLWLWRQSTVDRKIQIAGLIAASVLITPYALDYDLMALAPAIALMVLHGLETGFRPYEKSALAFAWVAPLISRQAASVLYLHPGLIGAILVLAFALLRARADAGAAHLAGGHKASATNAAPADLPPVAPVRLPEGISGSTACRSPVSD